MDEIRFARILLADDGSEAAGAARASAIELAVAHHAKLSVVYALEPFEEAEDARRILGPMFSLAEQRDVTPEVTLLHPAGVANPGRRIIAFAEDCGADVIVLGARGLGGVGRLLLGSVSSSVVHNAACSVLVAR